MINVLSPPQDVTPPHTPRSHGLSVTGVKRVFGDASKKLHLRLGPSDDIPSQVAAARGQAVDVARSQDV